MAATNYSNHVGGRQRKAGTQDRHKYKQSATANALRGQELPHAKLLDIDVIDIRSAHRQRLKLLQYIRDNLSNEAIAKKHGVHHRTIEKIVSYETWGHIA
jgi:DNA-binding NarL/FixJ family response regulator